ncbi:hypothetical protein BASA83_003162 [Batrachochytrium salamandrivorans]|nr:hypothetical protein BASA83_003162 [Batrachochytrium salamandrivorans]
MLKNRATQQMGKKEEMYLQYTNFVIKANHNKDRKDFCFLMLEKGQPRTILQFWLVGGFEFSSTSEILLCSVRIECSGTSGALNWVYRVIARHFKRMFVYYLTHSFQGALFPRKVIYVTESQLVWFDPETLINISIDYPTIIIHAISRQGDPFANGPCIYSQLSATSGDGAEISQTSSAPNSNGGSADNEETFEMRLVPDDPSSLDAIYQACRIGRNAP